MCFSTSASFGAGAILAVIGVASIKKAKSPSETFFASIPLIFSFQQFTEGFVWLSLSNPTYAFLQQISTYTFLFIAQVIWPTWVPLSIFLLEKKSKRKIIQKILIGIGIMVSAYLGFCLLSYHVEAKIMDYHISYELDFPVFLSKYGSIFYIIATIAPSYFSSVKRMWMLGTAILISYIISTIFYTDYVVSVWCFFASIISLTVFIIIYEINKSSQTIPSPTSANV